MDWNKVAQHLNDEAWNEFEQLSKTEDDDQRQEHRFRGFILKALADALFVALGEEPEPAQAA